MAKQAYDGFTTGRLLNNGLLLAGTSGLQLATEARPCFNSIRPVSFPAQGGALRFLNLHTYSCRVCELAQNPIPVVESLFHPLSYWCCLVLDYLGGILLGQVACCPLTYLYLHKNQGEKIVNRK